MAAGPDGVGAGAGGAVAAPPADGAAGMMPSSPRITVTVLTPEVSCTAAPAPVLSRERVERALDGRPDKRLAFIDIAVPRDVDPAIRSLPGVRLFDLDDLREWSSVSVAPGTLDAARQIVESETRDFLAWLAGRTAVPTIRELHERAEAILDEELGKIPEDERAAARRFTHAPFPSAPSAL